MTDRQPDAKTANDPALAGVSGPAAGFLEPRQLAYERCVPVPRAQLSRRAETALWIVRIAVLALVIIVGYTFITQLAA
jgi:hypothetical protein